MGSEPQSNTENYIDPKGKLTVDLTYTTAQRKIRDMARDFAEAEIPRDSEETVMTPSLREKMGELQFFGLQIPEEYGGAALDTVSAAICIEELSRVSASVGLCVSVHNSVAAYPVMRWGTPAQREKYLNPLARGEMIGAFCLTEPNAGSDASAIETSAEKGEEGGYIVNGQKAYITNGGWADMYLIFCRTGVSGISVLITDWGTEGVVRGNPEDLCGMRGNPVCSLYLTDAPVPVDNLLGSEGEGLAVAMDALDSGRIGIGAQGVGIAQAALDASLRYSRERVQFRKPISALQTIQNYLADMATEIEAARMLVFRAAGMKDKKIPFRRQAAMAKYYATKTAMSAATLAVQIHGAYGYSKAYPVERYFRDAKVTEIYEGANEVQRLVIARTLLDDLERGAL